MRIGVFGRGKLGSAIVSAAEKEADLEVAWVADIGESPSGPVDAALDSSAAGAVAGHLAWAMESRTSMVIATTGWDESVLAPVKADPDRIGVMVSPNFSLSVAFSRRVALALGRFAALDAASSLGIVERHHTAKADAPSGTAKLLAQALAEGCPRYSGWNTGRAEPDKINVASLRIGTEIGYHEIFYEAAQDQMVLSHRALSREMFAKGALVALRWMAGKKGLHSFDEVAADVIDPLFLK
jgi:4-hydroxy-tetrahydrodipicolinate reductase